MAEIMDDDALVLFGVCCVSLADSSCELSVFIRSVCCCVRVTISSTQIIVIVLSGVILLLL